MYSLNMRGRATIPSVKNFILEDPNRPGEDIVLVGKVKENVFSLDIHHPMNPFMGTAIALSSFLKKYW